jgi:hypothetical protein
MKPEKMGLDLSSFSTQAAFFDFDLDGDLDFFLMNHSLRSNGTFNERSSYINTFDTLGADYLFRNDAGIFTDISANAGINRSVIGYGLGLSVADIDLDGYPDLYIGMIFMKMIIYISTRRMELLKMCWRKRSGIQVNSVWAPMLQTLPMMVFLRSFLWI